MVEQIIREFPITVYGNLTNILILFLKARCRIFYKYAIEMVLILRMNLLKRNYYTIPLYSSKRNL